MALPPQLVELRRQVDRVDLELLDVLARRRELVARIADVKRQHSLAGFDPARESEMLDALLREATLRQVPAMLVRAVLGAILDDSRGLVG